MTPIYESIEHHQGCGTPSPIIGGDSIERKFHLQGRLNAAGANEYRAVCQCGAHSGPFTDLAENWPTQAPIPSGIKYEPSSE